MGNFSKSLKDSHIEFIGQQKMYFVATAPLVATGHINLSPKGMDSFRVISPKLVGYMDIIGSGNETSAHILENGRITIMFCSYDGAPNILRIYGKGHSVLANNDDPEWVKLSTQFSLHIAVRQIILVDVESVQTSCGYGVPLYNYAGERDQATKWALKKGPEGLLKYKMENNLISLDGLPTLLAKKG